MDRVMLVTGGSRGIGAAVARLAAERGYVVCLNYRERRDAALEVVRAIEARGGRAVAIKADMASAPDIERLIAGCAAELGGLDALVNNAGVLGELAPVAELSPAVLERMTAVNLTGPILCCRAAIPRLAARGRGAIVNLSSIAARLAGAPGMVAYAALKAAVDTFTVGLAREVGPLGIRVNAVRPGLIRTDMHAGRAERLEAIARTVPLGARAASPEEVARAILWLASDEASYVTGAILDVTGGR